MWPTSSACVVWLLFGSVCDMMQVSSQIHVIQRTDVQEDIHRVIHQIHSLSKENKKDESAKSLTSPKPKESVEGATSHAGVLSALGRLDLNAYYSTLTSLYALYRPLLGEGFTENLPKMLVCILSGRQDCGLEAELTKTVSLELAKPLLTFLSSLRSQTCVDTLNAAFGSLESGSVLRSYFGIEEVAAAEGRGGFQELFMTTLSHIPMSGSLMSALTGLVDMALTYMSRFIVAMLHVPMDYVKIGLQFGIQIPSLDERQQCQQGDLKQLLMWGMNHNVNWSFGNSILDLFLAPGETICSYPGPECQSPNSLLFGRSSEGGYDGHQDFLLKCDRHNLALFNQTLCADILAASSKEGSSTSVFVFCQSLSMLSPAQLEQVWSNGCHVVQALLFPVVARSPDCAVWATPSPNVSEETPPDRPYPRVARAALSLSQLLCSYVNWLGGDAVDAGLVTLCSDNDREQFVEQVCSNETLMRKLLSDRKNHWLWGYCANFSVDPGHLVSQFCLYQSWMAQPMVQVPSSLVAFCWDLDGERLKKLVCENVGLFTVLFSNPENTGLIPNCTELQLPPLVSNLDALVAQSCRYSEWHDVMLISLDVLSLCIRLDSQRFVAEVCSDVTFLNALLSNNGNAWLEDHCAASLSSLPTKPPVFFSISDWCNYHTWEERLVDPSVVGLCWQHDQAAFHKNVCCNMPMFEKLTLEPQNEWLMSVCTEKEISEMLPQVCRYSEWTTPIIVDMTDLALCAELDPFNFTSKVCSNATVLQNLLANLDNTWLLQHCANVSISGGAGSEGGGLLGFKPSEQCQYPSWGIALPDAALLALCWDYDQANFVSSICLDVALLSILAREPTSLWVSTLCAGYMNHSANNHSGNGSSAEAQPCLAQQLVRRFNWTCSADLTSVCQPEAGQTEALQAVLGCWVEALGPRVEGLLSQRMADMLEQAASMSVVILVALEESQMTSLRVSENIRLSVLESVMLYLERETNFDNKRVLLQCFGKVLTSLMQTGRDVTSNSFFLIKEYFRIPLDSLRSMLSAVDTTTARQILQYYNRHNNLLQLTDDYLSVVVSVLMGSHLTRDSSLFPDLALLLPRATPADIKVLPPLQSNVNVREMINSNLPLMSAEQRQAFGQWYGRAVGPSNVLAGSASLIRDTGNLIAYLPFQIFQHLSPAQLLEGLDVLQSNSLSFLQKQFVAQSLTGAYRNMTAQDFTRLGNMTCLAEPEDLLIYKNTEAYAVIQDIVKACARLNQFLPSHMISNLFLNGGELEFPRSLSASQLAELAHFLPWLGVDFLQNLTRPQLLPALPALASVSFTPTQASMILEKMAPSYTSVPGGLQALGSLVIGVKVEALWAMSADTLLSSLPAMAKHTVGLSVPQANTIATKLWGYPDVVSWLDKVEPLLTDTPLLSVTPRTPILVSSNSSTYTQPWNTQQAKAIFKEVIQSKPNINKEDFLKLGTVGQGVSCQVLRRLFQAEPSTLSVKDILHFLREQRGPLHTSLKKCVIEELYHFEFFSELLGDLGAEMALALPVSTIKKFPVDMMDTLRRMVLHEPHHFLMLPRTKQELLVDKIVQRIGLYTGEFTEEEFLSLGIMAPFVVDEVFVQLSRSFFVNSLELLRGLCYSATKKQLVATMLEEPQTFGPVETWNRATLNQVGHFLFFLSKDKLQKISSDLMTMAGIERLFLSQSEWERGEVGVRCLRSGAWEERSTLFARQQFLLQYFLGFLTTNRLSSAVSAPTCEILHTTAPAAWPTSSLAAMSSRAFSSCLDLIGQDPFLTDYQHTQLLNKAKEVHGPVSSFCPCVISQLGRLALQLSREELSSLRLTEVGSVSALGVVHGWTSRQLSLLFSTLLNSTKLSPSQLDSSTLVAMGHIVCGAKPTEMGAFNPVEFSKAALRLGGLRLSCSEEQLLSLVRLLTHSLAFGPTSSWGPDVFIEIGALAAGLPDMSMSALVKEQIEGVTPLAVSLIPPKKFAVVFDQSQISVFSYEQAVAVTTSQRAALSDVQQTALAMVLTPWEDRPVDFRGRSSGLILSPSPLCFLVGLLTLRILLPCP